MEFGPDGIGDLFSPSAPTAQPMPADPAEPGPAPTQTIALDRDQPKPTATSAPSPSATTPLYAPAPAASLPSRTRTGLGVLAAIGAGVAGYAIGGWWGLGAGVLLWGGGRNAVRASRGWGKPAPAHQEATKSAAAAVFGLGAGGFCAYKAYEARND